MAQNITFTVKRTLNNSSELLRLDLVVAMPITWMPLISDHNRFARTVREGVSRTFISYTIANAFADIYSAVISIQNIFPKTRQWKLSAIIGILSLILSYMIPMTQYENFLFPISAIFIPLFGILFADYLVIRKGK